MPVRVSQRASRDRPHTEIPLISSRFVLNSRSPSRAANFHTVPCPGVVCVPGNKVQLVLWTPCSRFALVLLFGHPMSRTICGGRVCSLLRSDWTFCRGFRSIFVLTQPTAPFQHRHISATPPWFPYPSLHLKPHTRESQQCTCHPCAATTLQTP